MQGVQEGGERLQQRGRDKHTLCCNINRYMYMYVD